MTRKVSFAVLLSAMVCMDMVYATEQSSDIQSQRLPEVTAGETPPLTEIPASPSEQLISTARIIPLHKRLPLTSINRSTKASSGLNRLIAAQREISLKKVLPLLSFDGLSGKDNENVFGAASTPPDVNGDVGPNHYVQMVNNLFQVFDKQGKELTSPRRLSRLFNAAGKTGPCAKFDQGDPIVLYDHLADRWLLTQFNYNNGFDPVYHECIAISKTGDPTGQYYVYDYTLPKNRFPDYPKFGVWPDGYYMTTEQYVGDNFYGQAILVFDRSKMLLGEPAATNYHNLAAKDNLSVLLPADLDGPAPPEGTPNYVIGFKSFWPNLSTKMRIFEVKADFSANATGSVKERSVLEVADFDSAVCGNSYGTCVSQPGVKQKLDALSDRPMQRLQYRYFSDNCPVDTTIASCATFTFNHTIRGASWGKAAVRWYILTYEHNTDVLKIAQQGTFAPNDLSRWMGSTALNKRGELAVGFSLSSGSVYPSVQFAGRLPADPVNVLTRYGVLKSGSGAQIGDSERWGDYSMMVVDPVDDCTFWYTNQYYTNNADGYNWLWRTRIGSFQLSSHCN